MPITVETDSGAPKAAPDAFEPMVKRYPMGLRTLTPPAPKTSEARVRPESCGPGFKRPREMRLDERDGDGFY